MKKRKLILLLLIILLGRNTFGQDRKDDLVSFVTKEYIHGFPYYQAAKYGNSAVPQLISMFKNPEYNYCKINIALMLGIVGNQSAFNTLRDYLYIQKGEINSTSFNTIFNVFQGFGFLAQHGNKDALNILIQWSSAINTDAQKLNISFQEFSKQAILLLFNRLSVQGLAIAGTPDALNHLMKMNNPSNEAYRSDIKSDINNAIALNKRVNKEGAVSAFGKELEQ
jgi:hypothetical protein